MKFGATRAKDGFRFNGHDSKGREHWLSPAAFARKRAATTIRSAAIHKRKMASDAAYAKAVLDKARIASAARRLADPVGAMLIRARARAKAKGIAFTITREHVSIPAICPVLGVAIRVAKGTADDWSPELDRIENNRGYVPGNVIVVCRRVNRIKNNATLGELLTVAMFYGRSVFLRRK